MNRPRLPFVKQYFQDIANQGNEEAENLMIEYYDIKDVDRHNNLYWDLYWYIFYKKNPDKITNETEHVSSVRIKSFDGLFDDYEDMYYSGEMMNGRPHGQGYASNEV